MTHYTALLQPASICQLEQWGMVSHVMGVLLYYTDPTTHGENRLSAG